MTGAIHDIRKRLGYKCCSQKNGNAKTSICHCNRDTRGAAKAGDKVSMSIVKEADAAPSSASQKATITTTTTKACATPATTVKLTAPSVLVTKAPDTAAATTKIAPASIPAMTAPPAKTTSMLAPTAATFQSAQMVSSSGSNNGASEVTSREVKIEHSNPTASSSATSVSAGNFWSVSGLCEASNSLSKLQAAITMAQSGLSKKSSDASKEPTTGQSARKLTLSIESKAIIDDVIKAAEDAICGLTVQSKALNKNAQELVEDVIGGISFDEKHAISVHKKVLASVEKSKEGLNQDSVDFSGWSVSSDDSVAVDDVGKDEQENEKGKQKEDLEECDWSD